MKLSKRLTTVIEMIHGVKLLADIGCDHGYVCMEAVRLGKCERAIAADVAKGPLAIAAANITAAGYSAQISTILSNGFLSFPKDAVPDGVNITGMGGHLVTSILEGAESKGFHFRNMTQLVLGPQSDTDVVRRYLIDTVKVPIKREVCIRDERKYYLLFEICPQEGADAEKLAYSESDYLFGKYPDPQTVDTYRSYLNFMREHNEKAIQNAKKGSSAENRLKVAELEEKNARIIAKQKEIHCNDV